MIKVLEHGALKINCPECRARLQYEQEDIQMDENNHPYIICPDCNNKIYTGPIPRKLVDDLDI